MSGTLEERAQKAREILLQFQFDSEPDVQTLIDSLGKSFSSEQLLTDALLAELTRAAWARPHLSLPTPDDTHISLLIPSAHELAEFLNSPTEYWFDNANGAMFRPDTIFLFTVSNSPNPSSSFSAVAHYLKGTAFCFVDVFVGNENCNNLNLPLIQGKTAEVVLDAALTPTSQPFKGTGHVHLELSRPTGRPIPNRSDVVDHLVALLRCPREVLAATSSNRKWFSVQSNATPRRPIEVNNAGFDCQIEWPRTGLPVRSVLAQLQYGSVQTCNVIPIGYATNFNPVNHPSGQGLPMVPGQIVIKMW